MLYDSYEYYDGFPLEWEDDSPVVFESNAQDKVGKSFDDTLHHLAGYIVLYFSGKE